MSTKKINVLKKAVQMLESGFEYKWVMGHQCNCGVVASAACGRNISYNEALNATRWRNVWADSLEIEGGDVQCKVTGLPYGEIQSRLINNGFTSDDIWHLEKMKDLKIISKANINCTNHQYYAIKENLLKYLRAWIELLTEEMEQQRETARELLKDKPAIRYIAIKVDSSIFEQAKELIKN